VNSRGWDAASHVGSLRLEVTHSIGTRIVLRAPRDGAHKTAPLLLTRATILG